MQFHYNTVKFLQNTYERHQIALMTTLLYIISRADSLFGQSIAYAHNKW